MYKIHFPNTYYKPEGYIDQIKTNQSYSYGESYNASSLYLDDYGTTRGVGASDRKEETVSKEWDRIG